MNTYGRTASVTAIAAFFAYGASLYTTTAYSSEIIRVFHGDLNLSLFLGFLGGFAAGAALFPLFLPLADAKGAGTLVLFPLPVWARTAVFIVITLPAALVCAFSPRAFFESATIQMWGSVFHGLLGVASVSFFFLGTASLTPGIRGLFVSLLIPFGVLFRAAVYTLCGYTLNVLHTAQFWTVCSTLALDIAALAALCARPRLKICPLKKRPRDTAAHSAAGAIPLIRLLVAVIVFFQTSGLTGASITWFRPHTPLSPFYIALLIGFPLVGYVTGRFKTIIIKITYPLFSIVVLLAPLLIWINTSSFWYTLILFLLGATYFTMLVSLPAILLDYGAPPVFFYAIASFVYFFRSLPNITGIMLTGIDLGTYTPIYFAVLFAAAFFLLLWNIPTPDDIAARAAALMEPPPVQAAASDETPHIPHKGGSAVNTATAREAAALFAEKRLTRQETKVAGLLLQGLERPTIAEELGVSVRTVATHINHLYSKLGVENRAAFFALFITSGSER
jgi:DNA-binding CsgD family transcriptional regulator